MHAAERTMRHKKAAAAEDKTKRNAKKTNQEKYYSKLK